MQLSRQLLPFCHSFLKHLYSIFLEEIFIIDLEFRKEGVQIKVSSPIFVVKYVPLPKGCQKILVVTLFFFLKCSNDFFSLFTDLFAL